MGRVKEKFIVFLIVIALFGFSLKNDTSKLLEKSKQNIILKTVYGFYLNKNLFQFSFKERVYIPFLEKWQEFKGNGYYEIGDNRFNIRFDNISKDHYICNGKDIFYKYVQEGKSKTQVFQVEKNYFNFLFPHEKKWKIFSKKVYSHGKLSYLIVLTPTTKDFPIKKVELSLNKKSLYVEEIVIIGNDDRILYFNILHIKKVKLSEKKLDKLFINEK